MNPEAPDQAPITGNPWPGNVPVPPVPSVPAQVTVFGIMHLVLAVFGLAMVAISGLMQQFTQTLMAGQATAPGMTGLEARLQSQLLEVNQSANTVYFAGTIILAILLAVAGVLLLKRRPAGLKVSNAYAWTSITLKLVSLVVFFAWTMPKLEAAMSEIVKDGGPEGAVIGNVMRISMVAGGVISPVVMCIYPVLALVLLNRPQVKAALGARSVPARI